MGRSARPRKPHRQKVGTPIVYRFGPEQERMLQLAGHAALANMLAGAAVEEDWHTLACRLNIGTYLAHRCFQEQEARTVMLDALEAIKEVQARAGRLGKYGLAGDEKVRIGGALSLVDDMQKAVRRRDLRDAIMHVFEVAAV